MKVAVGNDHAAVEMKKQVVEYLKEKGYEVTDLGTNTVEADSYAEYGLAVAEAVKSGDADCGVLICGTGVGISISANKVPGIRAALCTDCFTAEATRLHNDANILALGGRVVGVGLALKIVDTFLDTPFSNEERHIRRIGKIEDV